MINTWVGTGRIVNELELKYTQSGVAVLSFRLAVDRKYKNANGERETDFINCVSWRQTAETMAQHLSKGSLIGVEGHIHTRNYQHNQGYTVYITEIIVDNFTFLESKNQASNSNQTQGNTNNQSNYQNSTQSNFSGNQGGFNHDDPFENNPDIEISDDDLPFDFAPMR